MSKTKGTARRDARTAGKTAKNGNADRATRIDRWRRFAEERIAQLERLKYPGLVYLRTCAEIEGTTPAELIVDCLKAERLNGAVITDPPKSVCGAEWNAYIDSDYEANASTRARNNHEREIVNEVEFAFCDPGIPPYVLKNRGVAFLRRFYRTGDYGLRPAEARMMECALDNFVGRAP